MSVETHRKFDLADNQFRTAIRLFLSSGDNFSVTTLAGAADVIFCELVSRQGKENFTDYFTKESGEARKRAEVGREINDTLHINDLKHLDPGKDEYIALDAREAAIGAILKALANYNMLEGKDQKLINAFLAWVRVNLDPNVYNIYCDPNWKSTV
jgi:hypothetical protein